MAQPKFQVQLKILKPIAEVFDAVVDPQKLSGYFIAHSTGPLVEGTTVKWRFPEFPDAIDVVVREVRKDQHIAFEWPAPGGYSTRVEFHFLQLAARSTVVQISESGWPADDRGIEASYGNCGGWMHMLSCLKAYLEYGINLRAGGAL